MTTVFDRGGRAYLEPFVRCVRENAGGKYVQIPFADPRHLHVHVPAAKRARRFILFLFFFVVWGQTHNAKTLSIKADIGVEWGRNGMEWNGEDG